jgi:DNA-binding CsgD family transcriptional regulator
MPIDRRAAREILLYGLFAGVLIALLKLIEYRFLILEHSAPIYGGLVAAVFAFVGIRLGQKLTKTTMVEKVVVHEIRVPADGPFVQNTAAIEKLGITPREHEILELIASGLSNREIASRLFVSENTVKTHSSRLFDKLNAKRRTQAVQIAKEQRLIP